MYSARDRVEHAEWLTAIEQGADALDLGTEARSTAEDLFLSNVPEIERSMSAVAAASLYAGALIAGQQRSQTDVADAMGVTRLSIQGKWKDILQDAGFRPPSW